VSQVRILPGPPTCSYITQPTLFAFPNGHDRRANERALRDGAWLLSSYAKPGGHGAMIGTCPACDNRGRR
jgi:hypothetical protein